MFCILFVKSNYYILPLRWVFYSIIDNIIYGRGTGKSKKEAEQNAASKALEELKEE